MEFFKDKANVAALFEEWWKSQDQSLLKNLQGGDTYLVKPQKNNNQTNNTPSSIPKKNSDDKNQRPPFSKNNGVRPYPKMEKPQQSHKRPTSPERPWKKDAIPTSSRKFPPANKKQTDQPPASSAEKWMQKKKAKREEFLRNFKKTYNNSGKKALEEAKEKVIVYTPPPFLTCINGEWFAPTMEEVIFSKPGNKSSTSDINSPPQTHPNINERTNPFMINQPPRINEYQTLQPMTQQQGRVTPHHHPPHPHILEHMSQPTSTGQQLQNRGPQFQGEPTWKNQFGPQDQQPQQKFPYHNVDFGKTNISANPPPLSHQSVPQNNFSQAQSSSPFPQDMMLMQMFSMLTQLNSTQQQQQNPTSPPLMQQTFKNQPSGWIPPHQQPPRNIPQQPSPFQSFFPTHPATQRQEAIYQQSMQQPPTSEQPKYQQPMQQQPSIPQQPMQQQTMQQQTMQQQIMQPQSMYQQSMQQPSMYQQSMQQPASSSSFHLNEQSVHLQQFSESKEPAQQNPPLFSKQENKNLSIQNHPTSTLAELRSQKIEEEIKSVPLLAVQQQKNNKILEVREYQKDVVAQAKDSNSIIFMDTGTGKTIVSIYLIDHYIKKFQMTKQIIYLATTKVLVEQQKAQIENYLPMIDPSFYSQKQISMIGMHGEAPDVRIKTMKSVTKFLLLFTDMISKGWNH